MTKRDDDVVAIATIPGMVWEIKYRNPEQRVDDPARDLT